MTLGKPILAAAMAVSLAAAPVGAAGAYPDLAWKLRGFKHVRRIICHPTDPLTVWMVTPAGLLRSTDDGRTFAPVASATAKRVGDVTTLEVCPADERVILLGTDADGMFISTDAGQTWRGMSSVAEPLAALHVECIRFCRADPSFRTVMASHGTAAPGLSITRDLGKNWEHIGKGQYIKQFVKHNETVVAVASEVGSEGKVWGIHRSGTDGQRWEVCNRGIRPTECVTWRGWWRYAAATMDGEILESDNGGRTWHPAVKIARAGWVSLFLTHGPSASVRLMGAYDPRGQGLVLSTGKLARGRRHKVNEGLYVGPFVQRGARCRPNANGTTFYVRMNNALWVGRRRPAAGGPGILHTRCRPSTVWVGQSQMSQARSEMHTHIGRIGSGGVDPGDVRGIASAYAKIQAERAAMSFVVEAKVAHPKGRSSIKSVYVDASSFGRSQATPMFDDGAHADGKPADGLYAATITFSSAVFEDGRKRTWPIPGKTALTVTVTDKAGKADSWSAVVAVHDKPGTVPLWAGGGHHKRDHSLGPVSVDWRRGAGRREPTWALAVEATGPGPWRGGWVWSSSGQNIAGRPTLTFKIRGDVDQELYVQLIDRHALGADLLDRPHYSRPVPLKAGGYLKSVTRRYQRVAVPVSQLLPKGLYFLRMHCAGIALSAPEGGKPGKYELDQVQLEP